MKKLSGVISDKIRKMLASGELTPGDINPQRAGEAPPRASSIRHGKGDRKSVV